MYFFSHFQTLCTIERLYIYPPLRKPQIHQIKVSLLQSPSLIKRQIGQKYDLNLYVKAITLIEGFILCKTNQTMNDF